MRTETLHRCLANPLRSAILDALVERQPMSVTDLVAATGSSQSHVSHALQELRNCSLVTGEPEGKRVLYRLADRRITTALRSMRDLAARLECNDACTPECCP